VLGSEPCETNPPEELLISQVPGAPFPPVINTLPIFVLERDARSETFVERLVEIDDHNDAGFHGNSEERDVAHPYGHAEVVAQKTQPSPNCH